MSAYDLEKKYKEITHSEFGDFYIVRHPQTGKAGLVDSNDNIVIDFDNDFLWYLGENGVFGAMKKGEDGKAHYGFSFPVTDKQVSDNIYGHVVRDFLVANEHGLYSEIVYDFDEIGAFHDGFAEFKASGNVKEDNGEVKEGVIKGFIDVNGRAYIEPIHPEKVRPEFNPVNFVKFAKELVGEINDINLVANEYLANLREDYKLYMEELESDPSMTPYRRELVTMFKTSIEKKITEQVNAEVNKVLGSISISKLSE